MIDIDMPRNAKIVKKYPKVLNALRSKIQSGHYVGMLPGVQQLALEFDVNFMTVNKAVNMLAAENLLYRIPNKGTFVKRNYRAALVFLFAKESRNQRRKTVYDDLIHGVEEGLNERNITMIFKNIDPDSETSALESLKKESDGIMLLGDVVPRSGGIIDGFPLVRVMGAVDEDDTLDHVTFNNHSIGRLAAEHLLRKGHRICAFACSGKRQLFLDRGKAFQETLAKAGVNASMLMPDDFSDDDMKWSSLSLQIDKMLGDGDAPTGIFIPAAWMADSIYPLLKSRGIFDGGDVEVVVCDKELAELSRLTPTPVCVDIRADLVGKKAVEVLTRRIESPGTPRQLALVEPALLEKLF